MNILLNQGLLPPCKLAKGLDRIKEKEVWIRKSKGMDDGINFPLEMEIKLFQGKTVFRRSEQNFHYRDLPIALDPGHIGGDYSEMEGRHFSIEGRALR